ncbi:protein spinster isoform X1 [Anopheles bellator]|uniref:protein spinster isoform X1 n=1 Tax=Anopheles bellator TaxID=139047 RepID=UPI0026487EF8|nr:protein spinster isoform X1 [Anopheles bellator]XP_058054219.1 protein spinster isoform X1 [Anopheles bellator]
MPSQGYRKVASEPPIEAANVGGDQDSPSTVMASTTGPAAPGTPGTIQSNPAGKIPATNSQQRLMAQDSDSATSSLDDADIEETRQDDDATTVDTVTGTGRASAWFTVGVLCFVNLINYMDRFTIAGVLTEIQDHFQIGDDEGGLLQTAFVLSYMICAPIFGYLGDRYSRKWIMVLGVSLWSTTTLLGSYMNHFGWFITFRALVGIGEASYSTIAPTIISDLFVGDMRSKMLALFYFAIPVGSGCGYIIGAEMASLMNSWVWALRVTPVLGAIAVALIIMLREPVRGQSEASHHMQATSYTKDIKALVRNRSFMLSTGGFTCVAFVAGALAWWGPKFIHLGLMSQAGNEHVTLNDVSFVFGAITMLTGIIGVPLGSYLSQRYSTKYLQADPYICAFGLIVSSPLLIGAMLMVRVNIYATYVLIFFGELALNLNWAIVADILLYVVVPTRRSTAEAFQILISHALGDAGSPYFVGLMSEAIKRVIRLSSDAYAGIESMRPSISMRSLSQLAENATATTLETLSTSTTPALELSGLGMGPEDDTPLVKFRALQYSLFSTCFVEILGGLFFMVTAIYIVRDKARASAAVQSCQLELSESSGSASDGNATDDGLRQAIGPLCTGAPCDGGVHEHRRPFAAS